MPRIAPIFPAVTLLGALLAAQALFAFPVAPPAAGFAPPAGAGPDTLSTQDFRPAANPYDLINVERMMSALTELTAIGSGSLWRTSGSDGERQAFAWLRGQLGALAGLQARGATLERQAFRIPLATEVWEAGLVLRKDGQDFSVPVYALQGHRELVSRTLRFDTDGQPGDANRNPVEVTGTSRLLRSYSEIQALGPASLQGRVALADYAIFDPGLVGSATARARAAELLGKSPSAVVLVTSYSNRQGVSHGSFAGDTNAFTFLDSPAAAPTAFTRLEDLAPAGIVNWSNLADVTRVGLRLDVDVFSPADSELACLRIPGDDGSRAVILGAHLDSPNTPGALDNGSGSVALLEAARAFDAWGQRPPVDVWLCWFGSHERGMYGSTSFALAHQDLVDEALGMLQVDCLGHAVDGLVPRICLEQWSYGLWGDYATPFSSFVAEAAAAQGDTLAPLPYDGVASDNSSFVGFDVPSANTILMDPYHQNEPHIDNHLHDPYDTVALAGLHTGELAAMARAYLATALELGADRPDLRPTLPPRGRAVFVASHTEQPHMTPAGLTWLGMTLAWEQFDVDAVPYGQPVTAGDLEGAALVVVLPVLDYAADSGAPPYDEAWSAEEAAALRDYVEGGGLLVLTTSAYRLKQPNTLLEPNEDWAGSNQVGEALGVTYLDRTLAEATAAVTSSHPLVQGLSTLALAPGNGKAVFAPAGTTLALAGPDTAASHVPAGRLGGEVLALADLGILGHQATAVVNRAFWRNLARYARWRLSDLDGNGQVNPADGALLAEFLAGARDSLPRGLASADVNRDGAVNILDLLTIAGSPSSPPAAGPATGRGGHTLDAPPSK